jgi:hypothetical protein
VKGQFVVQYSAAEAKERPDDVIENMENLRKTGWKTMVTQCFAARCHVLETPIHPYKRPLDERLVITVGLQLDLAKASGNKVDYIGILTMPRGSASYFFYDFAGGGARGEETRMD